MKAHIFVGENRESMRERSGNYEIYFMDAILLFDNYGEAVDAYENLHGEAYLWFRGSERGCAELVEAKLMTDYHFLDKNTRSIKNREEHDAVHSITQRDHPNSFLS